MLTYAAAAGGALLAFWDGQSRGTRHMIEIARQRGLPTRVVMLEKT